jgi:serine protease Do
MPAPAPPRACRRLAVLLSAAFLLSCSPAQAPAAPSGTGPASTGPTSFAPMVKRVLPAVVNIRITETVSGSEDPFAFLPPDLQQQFRERFRGRKQRMQGAGSGFVIESSGYIVTNEHVVGHADEIIVGFADGSELPARVVGTDELTDVALIKVEPKAPLPYVGWGESRGVEVGDWVVAAGNPFGLGGSISAGIVSARGRDIGAGPFDDFLQIDAPMNPGNSGGPVFNEQGQVIGVDTAIASPTGASVGIGFAIPSDIVRPIVAALRDHGRVDRGWLGVSVADTPATEHGGGVRIAGVDRTGPALRAGLRAGDAVTAVNGQPVASARGLIRAIAKAPPGSQVHLQVRRGEREMEISVTVGRRPSGQG